MDQTRIRGFDGLRAIAVLLVFWQHRLPDLGLSPGAYGVRLFFVLSGFLIIGGLARERNSRADESPFGAISRFYLKRTLRIFPIYYLVLAVTGLLVFAGIVTSVTPAELLWHATYLSNVYEGRIVQSWLPVFVHLWSLAIEEQFYLFVAPLIILLRKARIDDLCLVLMSCSVLWYILLTVLGYPVITIYTDSLFNFGFIAMGGFFATTRFAWIKRIGTIQPPAWLIAYMLIPIALRAFHQPLIGQALSALVGGGLIISIFSNQNSALVDWLERPFLAQLGQISYGFYLYHNLITPEGVRWLTGGLVDFGQTPPLLLVIAMFAIVYGVSRVSWVVIEKPALALKTQLISRIFSKTVFISLDPH